MSDQETTLRLLQVNQELERLGTDLRGSAVAKRDWLCRERDTLREKLRTRDGTLPATQGR